MTIVLAKADITNYYNPGVGEHERWIIHMTNEQARELRDQITAQLRGEKRDKEKAE